MTKPQRKALADCLEELERLRYVHLPMFEGKVGEPNKFVIRRAKKILEAK